MKRKITLKNNEITFKEGYLELIDYCKINNFREATFKHYYDAYVQIKRYSSIKDNTKIKDIDIETYNNYVKTLRSNNLISENTMHIYCKDFKRFTNFFADNGYMNRLNVKLPKKSDVVKETYTDDELEVLLKKPNMRKCSFTEYKIWVIENFFMSTGIRLSSLINIKQEDVDFDNNLVSIRHTKNRKSLVIPLNPTIIKILKEYLRIKGDTEYLFTNEFGEQLIKVTLTKELYRYNRNRNCSVGIHKFRHTFAKNWVLNGGSLASLQKILGHSNLGITSNYVNLLINDVAEEVYNINILSKYNNKECIKLK